MKKNQSGFSLVMVLAILAVLGILLPFIVRMIQTNSRDAQKHFNKTVAYNLAEAGIEKAQFLLKSSTSSFTSALTGAIPPNFNFGKTFNDIPGGLYRIRIAPGPQSGDVIVISEGKDLKSREVN